MRNKAGFSLVEVLVVISLLMIIAQLSMVSIAAFKGLVVASELNKLYATAHYLQRLATSTQKKQILHFDAKNNCYCHNGKMEKLAQSVRFGAPDGTSGPPAQPTHLIQDPISFAQHEMVFYPDGIISPGCVYITDGSCAYALSSGVGSIAHVRTYKYNGAWSLRA